MNRPEKIIIHHSATKDSMSLSWPEIRHFHISQQGWKDIGYHAGIESYNGRYEILIGRPTYAIGAHCPGENAHSLGFVFVGDFTAVGPPQEMLEEAAYRILAPWCLQFGIDTDHIFGHNDARPTECPGAKFDINRLRKIVYRYIADV
jgi:hypothetical protein